MNYMMQKIIDKNKGDLLLKKSENSLEFMKNQIINLPKTLDFSKAFKSGLGIIAEIKLAAPSAGELADKSRVAEFVQDYKKGGAAAISIITEKYFFKGDNDFINRVKDITNLPVLQKDFVVDAYQIYESRISGADALLLIAKIINPTQLKEFVDVCLEVGVEPVVEINDETDLEDALQTSAKIIAVNARDLNTFKIDIEKACKLLEMIPDKYLKLGFSGVNSKIEVEKYKNAGAKGVLIGTNLMKAESKVKFLEDLR